METYTTTEIIRILKEKKISLFSLSDFERLFNISNQQTLYKKIARLEKKRIIQKIIKGKYLYLLNKISQFAIANFICQPSYISLESALSFYGITTGFSYKIISITVKKSHRFYTDGIDYQYSRIDPHLFWGYETKDNFLIAEPEKAIIDYIYFLTKGLRTLDWEEIELTNIDKKKLLQYAKKTNNKSILSIIKHRYDYGKPSR